MTDSDGNLSQLEAYILQLPENDTPDLNPPDWYVPVIRTRVQFFPVKPVIIVLIPQLQANASASKRRSTPCSFTLRGLSTISIPLDRRISQKQSRRPPHFISAAKIDRQIRTHCPVPHHSPLETRISCPSRSPPRIRKTRHTQATFQTITTRNVVNQHPS
jgi:hypothetical protein